MANKPLGQNKQNAFDLFMGILEQYGFTGSKEISQAVRKMILDGVTDFQQIELGLRDTNAWKKRFAGNEIRLQNGMDALSVSEYLSTEKSYTEILHNAGLPNGFYDDPSDFAKWIGGSTSPAELTARVSEARDLMNRHEDPATIAELNRLGITQGDLLSKWLDPGRSAAALQQKYQQVLIGAAARRAGVKATDDTIKMLAAQGITEQQAASGFGTVADITHPLHELGNIYGEHYNQGDAEAEVFQNSAEAARKRKKISGAETAAFSGSSGANQQSLGRPTAGSY